MPRNWRLILQRGTQSLMHVRQSKSQLSVLFFSARDAGLVPELVQSQETVPNNVEMAFVATQAGVESSVQSVTASESTLLDNVAQLTRGVAKLRDLVTQIRQKLDNKLEDVAFKPGQEGVLYAMASQLSEAHESLTAGHERFEQHFGRSATNHPLL